MRIDDAVGKVENPGLTLVTRACLVGAALLPWFALFSGTYGLYFYVVLVAMLLAPWLLIPALVLAAPLAALLLLIMPAGAVYAAVCRSPRGWAGRLTRAGCLVSMGFALAYGGLMVTNALGEGLDFFLIWLLEVSSSDSWQRGALGVG